MEELNSRLQRIYDDMTDLVQRKNIINWAIIAALVLAAVRFLTWGLPLARGNEGAGLLLLPVGLLLLLAWMTFCAMGEHRKKESIPFIARMAAEILAEELGPYREGDSREDHLIDTNDDHRVRLTYCMWGENTPRRRCLLYGTNKIIYDESSKTLPVIILCLSYPCLQNDEMRVKLVEDRKQMAAKASYIQGSSLHFPHFMGEWTLCRVYDEQIAGSINDLSAETAFNVAKRVANALKREIKAFDEGMASAVQRLTSFDGNAVHHP